MRFFGGDYDRYGEKLGTGLDCSLSHRVPGAGFDIRQHYRDAISIHAGPRLS
jgi:hypothetical protein